MVPLDGVKKKGFQNVSDVPNARGAQVPEKPPEGATTDPGATSPAAWARWDPSGTPRPSLGNRLPARQAPALPLITRFVIKASANPPPRPPEPGIRH